MDELREQVGRGSKMKVGLGTPGSAKPKTCSHGDVKRQ